MVSPRHVDSPAGETNVTRAPTIDELSDAGLVERACRGQAWAEEALFRKHVDFVSALAGRLLRDRAEADDVVQETFVAAFEGLGALTDGSSFRAWLTSIAVHKAHRRFRRRRLLSLLGLYESSHDVAMTASLAVDAPQEARAELAWLEQLLETSNDEDRAAWILRHVEGSSLEETAHLCGCSLTTVKRRIGRVQAMVEAHLNAPEEEDV